jgi:uncharacterized DUF497 family protein
VLDGARHLFGLDLCLPRIYHVKRGVCFGRAKAGRLLTVLYTERRGEIRVVTAYEMTKEQQRLYFEGK